MSQLRRHPDGGLDTHWLFHHYADELVASTKTEAEMLAEARSFTPPTSRDNRRLGCGR